MGKNNHEDSMYRKIPAVAELNKVPGFDPVKLLRRTISPETGEEVFKLEYPYKKLWFRLAYPKGRIRLNAVCITEQMAIYEAQIFLERTDENPIGSFTSSCTKEEAPGGHYIQAAQQAAMDEALSDAGFGIQFIDGGQLPAVAMSAKSKVKSLPTSVRKKEAPQEQKTVQASGATAQEEKKAEDTGEEELTVKVDEAEALPVQLKFETSEMEGRENILPTPEKRAVKEEAGEAIKEMVALLGGQNGNLPVAGDQPQKKDASDMPAEKIPEQMTLEEAEKVVVDSGVCKGWTLAEVAKRRPPSLKYYTCGGYKGENHILKAAAQIVLESLEAKKAG